MGFVFCPYKGTKVFQRQRGEPTGTVGLVGFIDIEQSLLPYCLCMCIRCNCKFILTAVSDENKCSEQYDKDEGQFQFSGAKLCQSTIRTP